jgi:hypothetical protein
MSNTMVQKHQLAIFFFFLVKSSRYALIIENHWLEIASKLILEMWQV